MSLPGNTARPLLTLAIIAYKQERYIAEAVASAFAQTYSPLEIIISDDCSPDGTFEIMHAMAAAYSGPHSVRLNRTTSNAGIGGHVTSVFELAQGELVLLAGGDDISMPERTQVVYEAWEATQRRARCIHSGYSVINSEGQPIQGTGMEFRGGSSGRAIETNCSAMEFLGPNKPIVFGCAAAWNRNLVGSLGPLPPRVVHEDEVLGFRTAFLGSFCCIESSLVKYRLHGENVFGNSRKPPTSAEALTRLEQRYWREMQTRHDMYEAFLVDLSGALKKSLISTEIFAAASDICRRHVAQLKMQLEFRTASFVRKLAILFSLQRSGFGIGKLRFYVARLIPEKLLIRLKARLKGIASE